MAYILGVDVGPLLTGWATVSTEPGEVPSVRGGTVASMVALTTDGRLLAGADVAQAIPASLLYTARNFVARLGDVAPVMVGVTPYGAESLVGHLVVSVLGAAQRQHGSRPAMVAFAHADGLDDYRTGLLIEAARLAGLELADVVLVAQLEARRALTDAAVVVPNSIELAAGAALVARERRSDVGAAFPPPAGEPSTGAVAAGGAALGVGGAVLGSIALGDVAAASPSVLAGTGFAGTPLSSSGAGFVGTAHALPGTGFAGTPLATPGTGFTGTPLTAPGTGFGGTPLESSAADVAGTAHAPPGAAGAGGGGTPPDGPLPTEVQAAESKSPRPRPRPRRLPAMFAAATIVVIAAGAAVAVLTQADSSSAPPVLTDFAVESETSAGPVEPQTTPPPVVTDPATVAPTPAPTTGAPTTLAPTTLAPTTTTETASACTVGSWAIRPDSVEIIFEQLVIAAQANLDLVPDFSGLDPTSVSGQVLVDLAADGTWTVTYDDWLMTFTSRTDGNVTQEHRLAGFEVAQGIVHDDGTLALKGVSPSAVVILRVLFLGDPSETDEYRLAAAFDGPAKFVCEGDEFQIQFANYPAPIVMDRTA